MERIGWEPIWSSDQIPPRFASFAEPNATVVEWADQLPAGILICDLGCGVGRHLTYLGGRGFQVAGADVAPTGIARTIAACAERGIACDGRVCNMTALPWPDATFDAALSTSTIHHGLRADVQRAIDEVWRVLKPGGQFLVDFPCRDADDYAFLRAEVAAGNIREVEPHTFVDERPETDDPDARLPHHFCDEADLRDLLRSYTIGRVWPALRQTDRGLRGKWVVWASATPTTTRR
jgi:SAM-dependent methyltransferase